jgi:DNA ligase-1
LRKLSPEEIELGVAWLAGVMANGRVNLGPAAVFAAKSVPAERPTLTLPSVGRAFDDLRAVAGKGAARRREEALAALFAAATASEQRFLIGLLLGELRQGALEGVMGTRSRLRRTSAPRTCAARSCWPAPSRRSHAPC